MIFVCRVLLSCQQQIVLASSKSAHANRRSNQQKKPHHGPAVSKHLGGTQQSALSVNPPTGTSNIGSYMSGSPAFGTWNMPAGTNNFASNGGISAFSGCNVNDGFMYISQICAQSTTHGYISYISFTFSNGDVQTYGNDGPNTKV